LYLKLQIPSTKLFTLLNSLINGAAALVMKMALSSCTANFLKEDLTGQANFKFQHPMTKTFKNEPLF